MLFVFEVESWNLFAIDLGNDFSHFDFKISCIRFYYYSDYNCVGAFNWPFVIFFSFQILHIVVLQAFIYCLAISTSMTQEWFGEPVKMLSFHLNGKSINFDVHLGHGITVTFVALFNVFFTKADRFTAYMGTF